jgi:hypothetical protein
MGYHETCSCGRIFTTPGAMKNHQNSCSTSRKHLSTVLASAKALFAVEKVKRLQAIEMRRQLEHRSAGSSDDLSQQDPSPPFEVVSHAI